MSNTGLPGDTVVKNPPSNAGDMGLTPGQVTKIPHAAGQLAHMAPPRPDAAIINKCLKKKEHTQRKPLR